MSRVKIDSLAYSDADEIIAANNSSKEYHSPWAAPVVDMTGFDHWYGQIITGPNASFVIRELDSYGIVGVVNLSQIVWGVFRSAYLGYYGSLVYARKGLMSEGLGLVIQHAFHDLRLHRLEANIQPDNLASIKLVRSNGFVQEGYSKCYLKIDGRWRDHERWALIDSRTQ